MVLKRNKTQTCPYNSIWKGTKMGGKKLTWWGKAK